MTQKIGIIVFRLSMRLFQIAPLQIRNACVLFEAMQFLTGQQWLWRELPKKATIEHKSIKLLLKNN